MAQPSTAVRPASLAIVAVVLLGVGVAVFAVMRSRPHGEGKTVPDEAPVDPRLILYEEVARWPTGFKTVRGLAVCAEGWECIAGDKRLAVFSGGQPQPPRIELDEAPTCVAIGGADESGACTVYAGVGRHVECFSCQLVPRARWPDFPGEPILTSIAVAEDDVYVADAGNRCVWRCSPAGEVRGRIGDATGKTRQPDFHLTNADFFDVAIGADGLLNVVNPRALRVEVLTLSGERRSHWGTSGNSIEGFFGCCNPAQIAPLSDGRFVTAEHGVSRVKIFGGRGKFECLVAGPEQFRGTPVDIAVDGRDRVLLLDGLKREVRVFARKTDATRTKPGRAGGVSPLRLDASTDATEAKP